MPRDARRRRRLIVLGAYLAGACGDGAGPAGEPVLAFTAVRGDSARLAIANADARGMRILEGFGNEASAAWSPDGTRLAFVRY